MKWVTKDFVHMDRVASPWLIKRFIDPEAQFLFVPWDRENERPADAIPFALKGVELGPHDAEGTTFQKLLHKYRIGDAALDKIARVIARGVDYVVHGYRPTADDHEGQAAVGLLAVSEGLMFSVTSDQEMLEASYPLYDALYANFCVAVLMTEKGLQAPKSSGHGPGEKIRFMRTLLKESGKAVGR